MGTPRQTTDGFERNWPTNPTTTSPSHVPCLPLLAERPGARVVNGPPSAARSSVRLPFDDLMAKPTTTVGRPTARASLANVMFALELQERCRQPAARDLPGRPPPLARNQRVQAGRSGPPRLASPGRAWPTRLMIPSSRARRWAPAQLHAAQQRGQGRRATSAPTNWGECAAGRGPGRVAPKGPNAETRPPVWESAKRSRLVC